MGSIYGSVAKFNDVTDSLNPTVVDAAGADSLSNISAIDIGTGPTDRNAQCVAVKSIFMKMSVHNDIYSNAAINVGNAAIAVSDVRWRIVVVLDKQPNKAAIVAASIWELPTDWNTPLNLDNRKRVKILKTFTGVIRCSDRTKFSNNFDSNTLNQLAKGESKQDYKLWMKFKKPLRVEYDTAAVTGVIGDIVDNAISVWFMVHRFNSTYNKTSMQLYARTRFVSC